MLFNELFFRNRQLIAQKKIFERVLVENVENVNGVVFTRLEIETMFTRAKTVERLPGAVKTAEGLTRFFQIMGAKGRNRLDGEELHEFIELVELAHGLSGKGDLVHRGARDEKRGNRYVRWMEVGRNVIYPFPWSTLKGKLSGLSETGILVSFCAIPRHIRDGVALSPCPESMRLSKKIGARVTRCWCARRRLGRSAQWQLQRVIMRPGWRIVGSYSASR